MALQQELEALLGEQSLSFFDAIAPVLEGNSLDLNRIFRASRYDKGEGAFDEKSLVFGFLAGVTLIFGLGIGFGAIQGRHPVLTMVPNPGSLFDSMALYGYDGDENYGVQADDCAQCYGCCGATYLCTVASDPWALQAARDNWSQCTTNCMTDFTDCEDPGDPPDSGGGSQSGGGSATS